MNEGTSKIDAVAAGVEQLRMEIVPTDQTSGGLLESIQLLLTESKERDQSLAVLHASVNGLFAAVHDRMVDGGTNLSECNQLQCV